MTLRRPFTYCTLLFLAIIGITLVIKGIGSWLIVWAVVYIILLVLGASKIQWNFFTHSYHKGKHKKWVALTFDDGPAAATEKILEHLKAHQVPAAFFSIGARAALHPELVKRWDTEGHLVGNHSYHHGFHFDWQSTQRMQLELQQTNEQIAAIIGKTPKLFRPPYGITNPNLAKAIARSGMHSIGWSIRSYDTTAKTSEQLLARILNKMQGGDIILLHDSVEITARILPELITAIRNKGYEIVRLDKLLDIPPYE